MVEVGSIEIGGSIQTAEIERGILRIEVGMKNISNAGKTVGSDFERIASRGKKLTTMFGAVALAGTGALLALTKGAPALAGSMAKINISMLKFKMAAGEAMKPTFDAVARGLDKIASWTDAHPDLFRGIVNSIIGLAATATVLKVGGWVYKAFSGFFGIFKGLTTWAGWASLKGIFKGIGTWIGNAASKVATAVGSMLGWLGRLGSKIGSGLFGSAGSGIASALGVAGSAAGMMIGPLINTYQRELTGEPGFLDKQLQQYNQYQFTQNLNKWSRNKSELDQMYML